MDVRRAIRILEGAYRDQAVGGIKATPPLRLMNRGIRGVAGALTLQNRIGMRLGVTTTGPGGEPLALLYELDSGKLLSIMGYPYGILRVSATVGLALEHLAPPDAKTVALIGSGRLAPCAIEAATAVLPVETVRVYSRSPERREGFARKATERFGVSVRAVPSPHEAIDGADIVLVSTNSPVPTLLGEWLRPGLSVFGFGRPNEFDDEVYLKSKLIVVSCKVHELDYYDKKLDQPLIRLSGERKIEWDKVAELGEVVAGKVQVDLGSDGIITFRESQGGYSDVALAVWAYEEALKRGLGKTAEFD
ncbi:MAG: hypothetical protein GTO40_03700 [Deltaproteobacteria bacterium]|nr:hypothetical protein [Deltaproteobacteria bacterium]